jgi:hypothetical protein
MGGLTQVHRRIAAHLSNTSFFSPLNSFFALGVRTEVTNQSHSKTK